MSRKRHKPEEIVAKLRQVDVLVAQGTPVAEAIRAIGAGTPKEAVASGWCFLVLLPTAYGAAYEALITVLVAYSATPALIVFSMSLDHRPD